MADAPKSSSAKKKKMSKAEKEKLKKEEQERKAQEEDFRSLNNSSSLSEKVPKSKLTKSKDDQEAQKIKAAEEAKKQKKEEAALAVERSKQENEERRRRREDMTQLQELLDGQHKALLDLNQARRVQAKWSRYMRCDGSPDPTNLPEINTYINLRLEDTSHDNANQVLKDSKLDLMLIEELRYLLEDTPLEELPEKERTQYSETIEELEKLISLKLQRATLQILCDATVLANTETGNLQHVVSNDSVSLCVWGNIMKNPRVRQFEFAETQFSFDIPRVLALSDCAISVLKMKFDHFSSTSKAAIPRRKKKEEVIPEVPEGEEQAGEEQEKKEGEEEQKEEGEKEGEEEEEKEETELDLMAALRGTDGEEEEQKEEEEEEVHEEDFEDPTTPEPTEWEDFDEEDVVIDLRANDVMGGVFAVNLLHMPPQPKTVGAWTITQVVDPPELEMMDYVADPPTSAEEKAAKDKDAKKDEKPPITISMHLPKDVMFLEEPQVAHWDDKKKFWTTDGVSDFNYNEDNRTFSFKTNHFGTMCLLQDSHINMPFQSWEIRPHKVNSAVLTIIAAIVEIEIEIKDALCCLSQPQDKPELESIRNKWVTPSELITMMKRAGVNVFPQEDSSKYVSIQNKHPLVEERMYQQMALTASAMAYSWSKWNGETDRDNIVFQASESLEDEPLLEEDWSVFLGTKRRVMKLKMTEFDESFNEEAEGNGEVIRASVIISVNTSDKDSKDKSRQSISGSRTVARDDSHINKAQSSRFSFNKGKPPAGIGPKGSFSRKTSALEPKESTNFTKKSSNLEVGSIVYDPFFAIFDHKKSPFKSNIYHLMSEVSSEAARTRVQETSHQFVDCVHQLLRATKVLTYA